MKQYFAKYLPVEGEIKVGDYYETIGYKGIRKCDDSNYNFGYCRKVKLFLCSTEAYLDNEEKSLKDFKIGEISPEATWVKEGDEFEEEDIASAFGYIDRESFENYQIKGPCGHFH